MSTFTVKQKAKDFVKLIWWININIQFITWLNQKFYYILVIWDTIQQL